MANRSQSWTEKEIQFIINQRSSWTDADWNRYYWAKRHNDWRYLPLPSGPPKPTNDFLLYHSKGAQLRTATEKKDGTDPKG